MRLRCTACGQVIQGEGIYLLRRDMGGETWFLLRLWDLKDGRWATTLSRGRSKLPTTVVWKLATLERHVLIMGEDEPHDGVFAWIRSVVQNERDRRGE